VAQLEIEWDESLTTDQSASPRSYHSPVGVRLEHDLGRAFDRERGDAADERPHDVVHRVVVVVVEDDAVGRQQTLQRLLVDFDIRSAGRGFVSLRKSG